MSFSKNTTSLPELLNSMSTEISVPKKVDMVNIPSSTKKPGSKVATVIPALKFNNNVYIDGHQISKFIFPDTATYLIEMREFKVGKSDDSSIENEVINISDTIIAGNPIGWVPVSVEAQEYFLTGKQSIDVSAAYDDEELAGLRYYEYRIAPWISGIDIQGAPPENFNVAPDVIMSIPHFSGTKLSSEGRVDLVEPGAYAIVGGEATGKSFWLRETCRERKIPLWRIGEREYPSASPSFSAYSRMIHEMCRSSANIVAMDSLAYISLIGAMDAGFQKGGISRDPVQLLSILQSIFRDQNKIAFFVINPLSTELDMGSQEMALPETFMSALRGGCTGTILFKGEVKPYAAKDAFVFDTTVHAPPTRKNESIKPFVKIK
jgi:hypothetical protein